jgi:hypothetical protein
MPQYNFGLGSITFIPAGANPTPTMIGVLSDVSIDVAYELKELRGSMQVAVDVARGPLKITGKAKNSAISGAALVMALAGGTSSTASKVGVVGETATIPTTPFQVTVANGATFFEDLGVIDLTSGKQMVRGATATGTNVYAVNIVTGQYTFNTADSGHNVSINYAYTRAAVGKTVTLNNAIMQQSTPFVLACYNAYGGKFMGWRFPAVHIPKLSLALKAEAYTEQDLDFFVAQDTTSAKVADLYTEE